METKTVSETMVLNKKFVVIYAVITLEDESWPFERIIALPVGQAVAEGSVVSDVGADAVITEWAVVIKGVGF